MTFALGWAGFVQQRAEDEADDRATCIARVERSIGNRDQWEDLIAILDVELPTRADIATTLRAALDANLPRLSIDDCPGG